MDKNTCVVYAPIETFSGYGSRARDIVKTLIELRKEIWDIKIISCSWGSTPMSFLADNEIEWGWLKEYILQGSLNYKPDYMFFVTIPSEFQPIGKFNIGCTAGIETTVCDGSWLEGLNRMDVNWVSSNHSKNIFQSLKFNKVDQQGNQLGTLQVEKPIEVVFEGCNPDIYCPIQNDNEFNLDEVKEDFAFLFNSSWIGPSLMDDRKGLGELIKLFFETFKNNHKAPALVLKTSIGTSSYMSKDEILRRILKIRKTVDYETLPNIYLLNGNITDEDINNLYNHPKIKAMIMLTRGEGWGRSLLEFSLVNKPIITTNWSGQLDFLDPSLTTLLPGELKQVHPSAVNQWILKEAKWFQVDHQAAMNAMKDMFNNYKKYQTKAIKQGYKNRSTFSYIKMKELIDKLLTRDVPKLSVYQPVVLPKLQKIE